LHHKHFQSAVYKKRNTKKMHDIIYDELIMHVCTPKRSYQWNENLAEEFPDEYIVECNKYK